MEKHMKVLIHIITSYMIIAVNAFNPSADGNQGAVKYCRNRGMFEKEAQFRLSSCSACYGFMFPVKKELKSAGPWLISLNGTHFKPMTRLIPDIHNETAKNQICQTLNDNECKDWLKCCVSAEECCRKTYYTMQDLVNVTFTKCPKTWDGFACWNDTSKSTEVSARCPSFIQHGNPSMMSFKRCSENSTWYTLDNGAEWTDYTNCVDLSEFKLQNIISLTGNAASLAALIPSVVICLAYRSLRSQHRIRLHIQLFISFILYSLVNILWDVIVTMDQLDNPNSAMNKNTHWCRLLNAVTRYTRGTNFMWMFCEACFLHRLIVNAFEAPASLKYYYLLGWVFPCAPVAAYSALRVMLQYNEKCWVASMGDWEWLLYTPNMLSLAVNLIFLVNILRILLTQLQSHPNEPSSYRKALKATFVLVPLFGLQMLVVLYRPPNNWAYDIFAAFVTNTQGFFVAVILCLLNGEVLALLRRSCCPQHALDNRRDSQKITTTLVSMSDSHSVSDSARFTKHNNDYHSSDHAVVSLCRNGEYLPVETDQCKG